MLTTLSRLFALLSLAALLSACAAAPGTRYIAPPAGTTYTSEYRDSGSYGNGTSSISGHIVSLDWNGTPVTGFRMAQSTLLVLPDGSFAGLAGADGQLVTSWEPPLAWEFPLEVGKRWTKHNKLKVLAPQREAEFDTMQVVEAYEDVVVPAGTFKAYRVHTSDTLGNENLQWFAPELGMFVKSTLRRTDKNAQGAGTRETQLQSFNRASR